MEKKREFTTKQVIVPARYFLECIAKDEDTKYPVEVSILGRYGCCHQFENASDLLAASRNKMFFENSVIKAVKRNGRFSIDLGHDGRMTIDKKVLPMRRHMETLIMPQVKELHQTLFIEKTEV